MSDGEFIKCEQGNPYTETLRKALQPKLRGNDLQVTFKDIVDGTERTAEFFSQNAAEDFIAELGDRFIGCNFERG